MAKDFAKHNYNMKTSATPSSDHLFKTISDAIILEETQAKNYHNCVANSVFFT